MKLLLTCKVLKPSAFCTWEQCSMLEVGSGMDIKLDRQKAGRGLPIKGLGSELEVKGIMLGLRRAAQMVACYVKGIFGG